jgi:hypothetical protein
MNERPFTTNIARETALSIVINMALSAIFFAALSGFAAPA